jgi:hypothetical protein
MTQLPLLTAIPRFKTNEERVDSWVNGDANTVYVTSNGVSVASIRKFQQDVLNITTVGVQWKTAVNVASTNSISSFSGEQTIDGVLTSLSRVLVKDQAFANQNGVWVSNTGVWSRALDANTGVQLLNAAVFVNTGTVNAGKQFVCNTPGPITVGTSNITFTQFADTSALNTKISALQSGKQDVANNSANLTYADMNLLSVTTASDMTLLGGRTVEGITFDTGRHDIVNAPEYNYAVTWGDTNQLALGVPRDGSRVHVRGHERVADFPDLYHWSIYGQSNAGGADALPPVSNANQDLGNVSFAMGMQTWNFIWSTNFSGPAGRGDAMFDIVPMYERDYGNGQGEFYSTGITGQFKASHLGNRYNPGGIKFAAPHMLMSSPTTGGIYLSTMLPSDTEGAGYYNLFKDDIARAKKKALEKGWSYGFGGVVFAQGESEASSLKLSSNSATFSFSQVRDNWANNLISLRASMQTDVQTITGQTRDMPMFAMVGRYGLLGEALTQVAAADEHVYVVGPNYFAPNAFNSTLNPATDALGRYHGDILHMSADGNRWCGEHIGKVMNTVLRDGKPWQPLYPTDVYRVKDDEIQIKFHVPVKPLQFDTTWTFPVRLAGLRVFPGTLDGFSNTSNQLSINTVNIISDDTISIAMYSPITANGNFVVTYGEETFAFGVTQPVAAYRDGSPYPNGLASKEIVYAGNILSTFTPCLRNGCFRMYQASSTTNPIIRDARYDSGTNTTVLRGEAVSFGAPVNVASDGFNVYSVFGTGTIMDSDPTRSMYKFTDTSYGSHQGKYYPLNNFCINFTKSVRTS